MIFEEQNLSLNLVCRYAWRTSDRFGFIKTSWIQNQGAACHIEVLDGIQNILPAFVTVLTQNTFSCLLDAYKRSEADLETSLAIYALNSTLTDLAEPSESLLATTVFQIGLSHPDILLSNDQLDRFRTGNAVASETEVRGKRGAFFLHSRFELAVKSEISWHIAADVSQDCADIIKKKNWLRDKQAAHKQVIEDDIAKNESRINEIVAASDGLQASADPHVTTHHFANVMFNVMRGGIFQDQYWIEKSDFIEFISTHSNPLISEQKTFFESLPEKIRISELYSRADDSGSPDLIRLSYSYLPLTFSRRHGDPSRPWNQFAIRIQNEDGTQRLDYEGNWRDIFQNWEALALSYPEFLEGMIATFLNATTADGYNPYRITRAGIEWEIPDPGNPWANIGYWSDHQIIYLLKLMELSLKFHPGKLSENLEQSIFSYANVPYRIKTYEELIKDPYNTIGFDIDLNSKIEESVNSLGTDGRLMRDKDGKIIDTSLTEKLLSLLLAKLVNFVPEGGIWMNTQRPEWNDANNALVGKGLSVVTLCYLFRFTTFFHQLLCDVNCEEFQVSEEVETLYSQITSIIKQFDDTAGKPISDTLRSSFINALGQAGSSYRTNVYTNGLSGNSVSIPCSDLIGFLEMTEDILVHSLRANCREDNLYHAYNILELSEGSASVGHLYEMLEGQVAILSSGLLSAEESLALLQSLRHSRMYRDDQHAYILYPDKHLTGFLEKNRIPGKKIQGLRLPELLSAKKDKRLLIKDENGDYHFSGTIHNERDVRLALSFLGQKPEFAHLVEKERSHIIELFETVFKHSKFTGRSGTFFAYEGLGSIYWHMVSKLLLAVQETILRFQHDPVAPALIECYHAIRSGLSFNKTPAEYGAFPSDPYSHTPKEGGAKQPGMTGLVKEEILARQAELGLTVEDGCLIFNPLLIDRAEFLTEPAVFSFLDHTGQEQALALTPGSLAYTCCQTPIILQLGDQAAIKIDYDDGSDQMTSDYRLDRVNSQHIFQRDGKVRIITVEIIR